jgi:hypothetical protein
MNEIRLGHGLAFVTARLERQLDRLDQLGGSFLLGRTERREIPEFGACCDEHAVGVAPCDPHAVLGHESLLLLKPPQFLDGVQELPDLIGLGHPPNPLQVQQSSVVRMLVDGMTPLRASQREAMGFGQPAGLLETKAARVIERLREELGSGGHESLS